MNNMRILFFLIVIVVYSVFILYIPFFYIYTTKGLRFANIFMSKKLRILNNLTYRDNYGDLLLFYHENANY